MAEQPTGRKCLCSHGRYLHKKGRCMLSDRCGCESWCPDDGREHGGSCIRSGWEKYTGRYGKRFL